MTRLISFAVCCVATAACGSERDDSAAASAGAAPHVEVMRAVATEQAGNAPGALYFTIENHGPGVDTLRSAETATATASLHRQVSEGDRVTMQPLDILEIPAQSSVLFAPGAYHVMLESPVQRLVAGDTVRATLRFARSGAIAVVAPVVSFAELESRLGGGAGSHAGHPNP